MILLDQCPISKTNEVLKRKCSLISGVANPLSSNAMARPKKERQSVKKLSLIGEKVVNAKMTEKITFVKETNRNIFWADSEI